MSIYDTLNEVQREAVFHTEGPLLVLAGAGSGKTRVLTHRIAYLIEEKGVNPWNILAITFTNKAAGEMRERVDKIVGFGAESIWVSTFHSSCVRILRRHIESLGYTTNFTIYDSDDQRTLMRQVLKTLELDPKLYKDRAMLSLISTAKNELVTAAEFELNAGGDFRQKKAAQIYKEYQGQLKKNNALDFDDLIMKTVELFQNNPEVLDYYQERFKYIMVDEYQDTNTAQFKLVSLLAGKYRNLCVVGDDDQSIYKFRGANIGNILNFEKSYPGAAVIKLEQNYRSSQNILNAANEVIRHNRGRKSKTLWTANEEGPLVQYKQFETAAEEADAIKDLLAYLKTIDNGRDDLSALRIINVPKRGIGGTSVGKVQAFASEHDFSMYDAFCRAQAVPGLGKAADKILKFTALIEDFRERIRYEDYSIRELIEDVLDESGYQKELEAEGEIEYQTRLENIEELINKAVSFERDHDEGTLSEFLEEVALVADVDRMDDSENRVTLMTLHSAKGLEFPRVYLSGMEDGLFPSMMSISSDDKEEIEEERRLCYVGITRAQDFLMLTGAKQRMINGETRYSKTSRFVDEIPADLLDCDKLEPRLSSFRKSSDGYGDSRAERVSDRFDDSDLPWGQGGKNARGGSSWGGSGAGAAGSGGGASGGQRPTTWGNKAAGVSSFGPGSNAYASKTASPVQKPAFGKAFTVQKSGALDYKEGDRVRHIKFGEGNVVEIKDGGKDYEVTVCFDKAGIKKMFASFAKLKPV